MKYLAKSFTLLSIGSLIDNHLLCAIAVGNLARLRMKTESTPTALSKSVASGGIPSPNVMIHRRSRALTT